MGGSLPREEGLRVARGALAGFNGGWTDAVLMGAATEKG